jgi:hypothetical protein
MREGFSPFESETPEAHRKAEVINAVCADLQMAMWSKPKRFSRTNILLCPSRTLGEVIPGPNLFQSFIVTDLWIAFRTSGWSSQGH